MRVIGEITLPEPAFRTATRLVEHDNGLLGIQYQHDGEPGAWLNDEWMPFIQVNMDAIIRTSADLLNQTKNQKKP